MKQTLLYKVGEKISLVSELSQPVEQITQMTQHALKASASSVLLLDEEKKELFFQIANGEAEKTLERIRLNAQSGVAGWVACHGKPLIINDVTKDQRLNKDIDRMQYG